MKFIFSQFWSLAVQDQGDSVSASGESSLPGLQMATFYTAEREREQALWCLVLYKDTNPIMRAPPS